MAINVAQRLRAVFALRALTVVTVIIWPVFVLLDILIPAEPSIKVGSLTAVDFTNLGYLALLCLIPLTTLAWFVYLGVFRSRGRASRLFPIIGWSVVGVFAALFSYYVTLVVSFFVILPFFNSLTH